MKRQITKYTEKAIFYLLVFLALLTPLFFVPFTTDIVEFNKQTLVILVTLIIYLLWCFKVVIEEKVVIRRSLFDIPMAILLLSFILSLAFSQGRIVSSLSLKTWTFISFPLLYFSGVNNIKTERQIRTLLVATLIPGGLLGLFLILRYFGPIFSLPFFQNKAFTPFGSLMPLSVYFFFVSVIGARIAIKQKGVIQTSFLLLSAISLIALLLSNPITSQSLAKIFNVSYPKPVTLDARTSWNIAIQTFKQYPLTGAGVDLYDEMFTQFKGVEFNQNQYWNIRFTQPFNQWFEILTLTGLLGFIAFGFLSISLLKNVTTNLLTPNKENLNTEVAGDKITTQSDYLKTETSKNIQLGLATILISSLFVTFNTPLWVLIMLLGISKASLSTRPVLQREELGAQTLKEVRFERIRYKITFIVPTLVVLISVFGFFNLVKAYRAEIYFKQAQDKINDNKGTQAYELLKKAINLNPRKALYRARYAQINIALADSYATEINEQPSGEDREKIQSLIQQAIRDIKLATEALNPLNSTYWEIRGSIYNNIRGVASGSEQWAVTAYSRAISLDPNNPNLRLALGGVFYAQSNWEEAAIYFRDAVNLKPDFANAHYNLAWALRLQGKTQEAISEYNTLLSILDQSSSDYTLAKAELDQLTNSTNGDVAGEKIQKPLLPDVLPGESSPSAER